jgi:biotin carboxyl carrier protein
VAEILAPMAGKIIEIKVNVGDTVHEDDEVAVIEAMKMEMPIMTDSDGTVKEIKVKKGDSIEADQVLMIIE